MSVRVEGIQQAVQALEDYKDSKTKELQDDIDETVINVERKAKKQLTSDGHIDTGRLRASIHPIFSNKTDASYTYSDNEGNTFDGGTGESAGSMEGIVITNVDYAMKIEAMDSYMFKSWEDERPEFIDRIRKTLGRIRSK